MGRDINIIKGYMRELNLQTRVKKDKKKYSRKEKHQKAEK